MKKRILTFILITVMCFCTFTGVNAQKDIPENPRAIPESVYELPYQIDQQTSRYAPWLRHLHILNEEEYNKGVFGGEACQLIRVMAISPIDSNVLYFISDTTGVWKTTNGGGYWYNTNNNIASYYGTSLLCDRLDVNTVYAYLAKDGLYRSTNGGKQWQRILKDPTQSDWKNMLAQDAQGNVYIANYNGIHKLPYGADEVETLYKDWNGRNATNGAPTRDIWVSDDGQTIYVAVAYVAAAEGIKGGLYCSFDGGKTWEIREPVSENGCVSNLVSVEVHPEDFNKVYISGSQYHLEDKKHVKIGTFESFDGGKSATFLSQIMYINEAEGVPLTGKWTYQLNFGPKEDGIYPLYCYSSEIQFPHRVSYDYGRTWKNMYYHYNQNTARMRPEEKEIGETGWWGQGYAIDHNNPGVVYWAGGGPQKWDHGKVSRISSGYSGLSITTIEMTDEGKIFAGVTDIGSMVSTQNFTKDTLPLFQFSAGKSCKVSAAFDPKDENHVIAFDGNSNSGKKHVGIMESFDGGITFSDLLVEESTNGFVKYDPDNPDIIYSSEHTSYDNGKTWVPNARRIATISEKNFDNMASVETVDNVTKLYLSHDRGKTWEYHMNITKGTSVKFDIGDDNYMWNSGLYNFKRINLETKKAEDLEHNFPFKYFHTYAQNPKNPAHVILSMRCWMADPNFGKNPQYMETRDYGKTWHVIPGLIATQTQGIYFSKVTDEAILTGHSGTWLYDYNKYWEFLDSKITVELDGKEVSFSVMPEIIEGRTMVPMRELFEMLGATVNWDGETRTVTAVKGKNSVKLQIDNALVVMNGKELQMEAAPYIKNSRTMVPLRFASEALGIRVGWDNIDRLIVMLSQ